MGGAHIATLFAENRLSFFVERGVLPNCVKTLNETGVISQTLYVTNYICKDLTRISKYYEMVEFS